MKQIGRFILFRHGLIGIGLSVLGTPVAYAWTDDTPVSASQCGAADVNDVGTVIENCKVSNASVPYVTIAGSPVQLSALPNTVGGVPCSVMALNNAAAGQDTIVGSCRDAKNVSQAVAWSSGSPNTPRQLMPYSGVLAIIGGGVKSSIDGVNLQGVVIGESIDANETRLPVYWAPGANAATPLNALLALQANCVPTDINDVKQPSVVGNCPAGDGRTNGVLWPSLASLSYTVLPAPAGASYCSARQINLNGQILGECIYGSDTYRAVVWGSGGTGPTVLQTINGNLTLRTVGVELNDAGLVAVNFLGSQSHAGFLEPALWNPASGANASSIALPSGAIHGTVSGLGNNNKLVGNFETVSGDVHPFHVEPNSLVAVDDGAPAGGPSAGVVAWSKSGVYEAVTAEDSNQHLHAEVQTIP
ncbi:hypothetical protein FPJ27_15115 [Burkholderia sp. MS455]|uniref:hypothetical protein n=1 Tax=Burkholderia sp. MS455 TaxID=2811788 RepID=UPI001959A622|nr:hypothetical protein [Burkholderia sp. MS455]QRR07606.1 hypothetical protein FPJ27_15115 [Burkholderia sp. MS455]